MKKYLFFLFVFFSSALFATSFVVPPATGAQTLAADETGIVESVGSLDTSGVTVTINGDGAYLNNAGIIISTGSYAVNATGGNDQQIINSGTISAPADYGVQFTGNNFLIQNSGLISADYYTLYIYSCDGGQIINTGNIYSPIEVPIFIDACTDVTINNSGIINTAATGQYAFDIDSSPGTQIINNGTIASGSGGYCVYFDSSNNSSVINNGTMVTENGVYGLVFQDSTDVQVTNNGMMSSEEYTVEFTGVTNGVLINNGTIIGIDAVLSDTSINVEIINGGTIMSSVFDNYALSFIGSSEQTLTLLRGSNIQGELYVDTNPLNLNVERGSNVVLTISGGGEHFGALGIVDPYVVLGDPVVAVIDPTGLVMQADVLADISDVILNGVYDHLYCSCRRGCAPWAAGLGSYRDRKGSQTTMGYYDWQGGGMIGEDFSLWGEPLSAFVGCTFVAARVSESTQKADVTTVFAGLSYNGCLWNTYYEISAVGGYVNWYNKRYVMNNLAPGGVETAKYRINRGLFTAEAALWRDFSLFCNSWCPELLFNFRYAGLYLGSYGESGSLADLSVKGRSVNLLTTRLEMTPLHLDKGFGLVDPYVGVFGRYQVGGYRVDGALLGTSFSFNQGGPRNLAAFVVGVRTCPSWRYLHSFLNVEVSFDSAKSTRVLGEGGLRF